MQRWVPPAKGVKWSAEKCHQCGGRIVSGEVVIWCENNRGWRNDEILDDGSEPDGGIECDFILASG